MSHNFQNVWLCCHGRARHKGKVEGGGTPKGKARHTINLQEASYDVLMIQKESLQSSFVTDPDDGSFTQIPWYLMCHCYPSCENKSFLIPTEGKKYVIFTK